MNLQEFPQPVKNDIEDQSLSILEHINEDVIVIGGWAVRALVGEKHGRYTLDIDGIAEEVNLKVIEDKLSGLGMKIQKSQWGLQFNQTYQPSVDVPDDFRKDLDPVQLRIEISRPRIQEAHTLHYFEFSLTKFEKKQLRYHMRDGNITVKVPPVAHMVAVKLGLPVDYKNNLDAQVLLEICDIDEVIGIIKTNDNLVEMVLRRIPKLIGRLQQKDSLEHILALNVGINIKEHIRIMKDIEKKLTL
jgi:hypothetical protein